MLDLGFRSAPTLCSLSLLMSTQGRSRVVGAGWENERCRPVGAHSPSARTWDFTGWSGQEWRGIGVKHSARHLAVETRHGALGFESHLLERLQHH